jgi:hypothetical protein
MKALKLSTLAACLFLFVSSCTKTVDTLSSSSTSTTSSQNAVMGAKAGGQGGEQQGGATTTGNEEKTPVLTPSRIPAQASAGTPFTVSYTATDPGTGEEIECGVVTIFQWINNDWKPVASGPAPTVSFTIQNPTAGDCAYKFRAGFNSGGAGDAAPCRGGMYSGVGVGTQHDYCVNVAAACNIQDFGITGVATAVPVAGEEGMYEFTITFTLKTPEAIENIHFQGGATAGGQFEHELTDKGDMTVLHDNKQNTVLYWEGSLTDCGTESLTFKYKRRFSCPATDAVVTGDWTATVGGTQIGVPVWVTYSCGQ